MKAVVAAFFVVKHQRRRLGLPGFVANFQESGMFVRIRRSFFTKSLSPAIRNYSEVRIGAASDLKDQSGQRVGKILVVADAEAIALHNDVAAKTACVVIKRGDLRTFRWRQDGSRNCIAALRKRLLGAIPVQSVDPLGDRRDDGALS